MLRIVLGFGTKTNQIVDLQQGKVVAVRTKMMVHNKRRVSCQSLWQAAGRIPTS